MSRDQAVLAASTDHSPDPGEDVTALAEAIRDAAGQLIRRVRQESGTTLTLSQSVLLSGLFRHGRATASELAADNGLRPQTVWSSLATLEKRGLVSRERDTVDRRNVHVSLTERGRAELIADRQARRTGSSACSPASSPRNSGPPSRAPRRSWPGSPGSVARSAWRRRRVTPLLPTPTVLINYPYIN